VSQFEIGGDDGSGQDMAGWEHAYTLKQGSRLRYRRQGNCGRAIESGWMDRRSLIRRREESAAVALGKLGGLRWRSEGKESLTTKRKAIAKKAAQARWKKD